MPNESVTLVCKNCGAKLQVTPEIDRFVCQFCGSQQIVKRSETAALQPFLTQLREGAERTAAELAIRRLSDEIVVAKADALAAQEQAIQAAFLEGEIKPPLPLKSPSTVEVLWLWGFLSFAALGLLGIQYPATCLASALISLVLAALYFRSRKRRKVKQQAANEAALLAYEQAILARENAMNAREANVKAKFDHIAGLQRALERNRRTVNS